MRYITQTPVLKEKPEKVNQKVIGVISGITNKVNPLLILLTLVPR